MTKQIIRIIAGRHRLQIRSDAELSFRTFGRTTSQAENSGRWVSAVCAAPEQPLMDAPSCRKLNTALRHLHEWGLGLESATKLFWHMKALELDEFDNYACRLVSIGSSGSDGGKHAQKHLLRMIGDELGFGKFVTSVAGAGSIRDCILPSTWFQLLARRPH